MFFGFSAPKIGGVLMKTFPKPSFTHFFQKKPPGGGGLPYFTRCGTNYLHTPLLKKYPKSKSLDSNGMFFRFSAPKIGGVLMKTFSKPSFTHFPQKWPPGGGVYQISQDVALTTCIHLTQKVPKEQIFGFQRHVFWIQCPQNRRGPHENIFKTLIYPFFPKMAPGGGGVTRFHQTFLDVLNRINLFWG